jgi:NhaP-type Na+/H+ or K+/H+ antiporter
VLGSFFAGAAVYFAYIGGALLTVQSWTLSQNEVSQFVGTLWTSALTIASAIVAREVSVWFGAWIAARGRRMRERNRHARDEYERRLAEGPAGSAGNGHVA